ncbi:hypothetical protein MnTg01_00711 [archaeon MnTg01]|nr:hypothetical protein MnTg01_00711 [archaeon MnTg01]
MRGKYVGFIAIAIGITVAIGFFASSDSQTGDDQSIVFHVTLADPQIYKNGVYSHFLKIEEGMYEIRFVPNGDSPKILTITLNGQSLNFFENFALEGTPQETGVSTYYTWEYSGNKIIKVPNKQEIEILIDPNGNLLGPVSIDIIKI